MAYDTRAIKTDVNGKPIPQYYDALHDEYRPLQGEHGASRAVLYGPDGRPLSTTDGKIDVRASELEALIGEVQESPSANTLLARLKTLADTLGTEATLQAVKIALDSLNTKDYATQATLAEVLSRLEAIEQRLDSGEAQVQLKGRLPALNATDPETGEPVPVQAVQDDAGNWVLGIVDRAPYAYDPVVNATRVVLPTLVSGVYTHTNALVRASSSWSTDIIESGEAQRIRLMTFVSSLFFPNFVDLNLEWYADVDGQWMIVREVREVTGEPADREIKFENIKPIRGNVGIGTATVKGPYFRFTFFNTHESVNYTINRLAIHKFLDG